jgi:hypothetical protein
VSPAYVVARAAGIILRNPPAYVVRECYRSVRSVN